MSPYPIYLWGYCKSSWPVGTAEGCSLHSHEVELVLPCISAWAAGDTAQLSDSLGKLVAEEFGGRRF